jgi:hypothetical protein
MTLKTETYSLGSDSWTRNPDNVRISLTSPELAAMEVRVDTQTTTGRVEIPVPTTGDFITDLSKVSQRQAPTQAKKSRADVIVDEIHSAVSNAWTTPEGNPKPTNAAITALTKLLAVVPASVLGEPDVDVFYGEIHLQWNKGNRQLVLMAFSKDKEPLLHYREGRKGKASRHDIEKATAKSLIKWLRWLNG